MSAVLVAVVALPLMAAGAIAIAGKSGARATARLGTAAAAASVLLTIALCWQVVGTSPVSAVLADGAGKPVVGFVADRLTVVLLLLVTGVSAVVQAFAGRYLAGDARAGWFSASAGLLTAASAGLVSAATLVTLAACWTVAGIALCLLLATYPSSAAARLGVVRTARTVAVGDLALWLAVALITARWGSVDLRHLDAAEFAGHPVTLASASCLVVVAALARSAQVPLQRWLPATLAAPTPVSALLHAGVVNAGGVLLVRLGPLVGSSPVAMRLAFAAGAVTAAYGTLLMLAKPDIKGALVHSTMGQMGFLIMTCGLGLWAAAVIHLVAHGLYKATLFLSSGSAVSRHVRHRAAPRPAALTSRRRILTAVIAGLMPAAALLAAATRSPLATEGGSGEVLLVFGWAAAAAATAGWLRRQATARGVLIAAPALLAGAAGYVGLLHAADRFMAPALPALAAVDGAGVSVLAVAGVLALLAGVRRLPPHGRWGHLQRALYVLAVSAGSVHRPRRAGEFGPLSNPRVRAATLTPIGARS